MTMRCVRFDQELGVAHEVASGFLPCPQALLLTNTTGQRVVEPCGLEWAHDGDCQRIPPGSSYYRTKRQYRTGCGLDLDDAPFVIAPAGLKACPDCFPTTTAADYVESELFA